MVSVTTFKHYLIEHKLHFVTCGPIRAKKKKERKENMVCFSMWLLRDGQVCAALAHIVPRFSSRTTVRLSHLVLKH